jgi:hypothetical protein
VSISQREQTVAVTFENGTAVFSAGAFRAAMEESGIEIMNLEAEACGVVDGHNALHPLRRSGQPLFRLQRVHAPANDTVCVSGWLDDRVEPYVLRVVTVRPQT